MSFRTPHIALRLETAYQYVRRRRLRENFHRLDEAISCGSAIFPSNWVDTGGFFSFDTIGVSNMEV